MQTHQHFEIGQNSTRSHRRPQAGSVDYKKVVELKGVDLERYRGKAREEVRVSVAG